MEKVRMKLPAERAEVPVELGRVNRQPSRETHELEVIALASEGEDSGALRTEVDVYWSAAAAALADLNGRCTDFRGHPPKELPQPQVVFAFGLLNTNPLLIKLVS